MNIFKTKQLKIILTAVIVIIIIAAGMLWWSSKNAPTAGASWWNDNWSYRKAIVINSEYVEADLTDFPVLISFTDSNLSTHAQEDGDDFIFIDTEGKKLAHEIESFATTTTGSIATGTLVAWVKIPGLSSTVDTVLYLYYGNASVSDQSDAENVWDDNYVGVWHLNEASGTVYDSTSNNNDLTSYNSPSYAVSAKIGDGLSFNSASSQYLKIAKALVTVSPLTITAWVNLDTLNEHQIVAISDEAGDSNWFDLHHDNGSEKFQAVSSDAGDIGEATNSGGILSSGTWYHAEAVFTTANNRAIYYNGGTNVGTDSSNINPAGLDNTTIGVIEQTSLSGYFNGDMDEVRISNTARSEDWIKTSFTNQASTTLFLSPQAEETGPGPVGYWTFDEGYGTTAHDESGQGNDGTITGAAWQDESMCVSGKCLWFDGSASYVDVGTTPTLNLDRAMSAFVWVRMQDLSSTQIIVAQTNISSDGQFELKLQSGKISVTWSDSTQLTSNYNFQTDRWYYIGFIRYGSTGDWSCELYIDGQLNKTSTGIAQNPTNQTYVAIGRKGDYSGSYFHGFIDEVKIYPYARSAEEIKQDYMAGLAGVGTRHGVSAAFGSASESWMTDGLVGYWQMDETATTSGAPDASGNGNNGTYYGDASTTAGKFGNGGSFDGSGDYVDVPYNSVFDVTNALTIAAWVKPKSIPGDTGNIVHRRENNVQSPNWGNLIKLAFGSGSIFRFEIFNGSTYSGAITSNTYNTGEWYFVVGVFNGINEYIYIDGIDDTIGGTNSGVLPSSNYGIKIGCEQAVENYFDGQIDEVRIYNRALSPREVRKLYEWAPGPVAHWRFDEMTGTTAYDSAASTTFSGGNHGALQGGPTWTRGKYGSALELERDNGNYINVGDPANGSLDFASGDFSLAAWVYTPSKDTGSSVYNIMSKWQYSTTIGGYDLSTRYGHYVIKLGDDDQCDIKWYEGDIDITEGVWEHITVTVDRDGDVVMYLNGGADTYSANISSYFGCDLSNAYDFNIGSRGGSGNYFDGQIDDVRIYNYALNQKQIINVMNGRKVWESAVGSPVGSEMLYLKFDKGYGGTAYDSSPQGNNGTLFPGTLGTTATSAMWSLEGKFGRAMEFDGQDDWVELPNTSSLNIVGPITITAWIKTSATGAADCIVDGAGPQPLIPGYQFVMGGNSGGVLGYHSGAMTPPFAYSNTAVNDGVWHHVAVVVSNTTADFYKDGLPDGSSTAEEPNSFSGIRRIGRSCAGDYFDGLIDDVRIYNFALNEDEIKLVYNQGMAAVMGAVSTATTTAGTHIPSWSASREYCVPGSNDYCAPPVGEWRFDEKAGTATYDKSGQGNDGAFVSPASSPTWRDADKCKIGSCLEFDGNGDYVDAGSGASLNLDSAITMSAWIKTTDASYFMVIQKYKATEDYEGYAWRAHTGKLQLLDGITWRTISTTAFNDGNWHHIAVTASGSSGTHYLNGTPAGTFDFNTILYNANEILYIGAHEGTSNYFTGILDQVRVYNYARTPAQIAWDYNQGKPIAHWRFDECKGGTIYDQSRRCKDGAGCNNGTLQLGTGGVTVTGTCASSSSSTFWGSGSPKLGSGGGSFDGDDDRVSVSDTGLDINTVSFWMKPTSTFEWIMELNFTGSYIEILDGMIQANGFTDPTIYIDGVISSMADTNWHNISITTHTAISMSNMTIGAVLSVDPPKYFNGLIDEVKIFNYALTEEQIKTEYNSGAVRFGE